MKKVQMSIALLLVFAIALSMTSYAANISDGETVIGVPMRNEPYVYPTVPGTAAWSALETKTEKIAACHVSESILQNMTTEALVETVLTYPLLIDIFAYSTMERGLAYVSSFFGGIDELRGRSDASYWLQQYLSNEANEARGENVSLERWYANVLLSNLETTGDVAVPYGTDVVGYTPRGTPVYAEKNRTWADHGVTEAEAIVAQAQMMNAYPDAQSFLPINPAYNCHSYAWYRASSSNTYWIYDPGNYMRDGSYVQVTTPAVGDIAYWGNEVHSAIVYSTNGEMIVASKWGALGAFRHTIDDCPYSGTISYWTLNG